MDPLPLSRLAEFCRAQISPDQAGANVSRLSTDSRSLQKGDLFVALRGDNFDGHVFVEQAAAHGASGALVEQTWHGKVPDDFVLLRVEDTLAAYQQIAAAYRRLLPLKVIAITGSNGKTSTKDFVASVLARGFRVTKTAGNLNNHVGLPRTMLEATAQDEIGVWEIGMNHAGEVAALAKLAAPNVAIITNVGVAHIEYFGTREAIAIEKGSLAEAVGPKGTVILNADDDFSERIAGRTDAEIVVAGIGRGSLRATEIRQSASGSAFVIVEGSASCPAQLPVPGAHMVQNAMLAVAAGRVFGISLAECAAGLAETPLTKARLQIKSIHGVQFIDDSYNANPDSMKAAVRTLSELEAAGQRIAVLGQMGELGAASETGHREVGEAVAEAGIDRLLTVGAKAEMIARAAEERGMKNVVRSATHIAAAEFLGEHAVVGDLVLIKGSRSAQMERVLEEFEKLQLAGGNAR